MLSNHSTLFILVSWYVIVQLIYNTWILSLLSKWRIIPVFTFDFWKSCISTCQLKINHLCAVQKRRSVLLIGLCWPSNVGRPHKCNMCINTHSHRPCTRCYDYLTILKTLDACLSLWDTHIGVNLHLGNTCLLFFWQSLKIEPPLLTASLFLPLHQPWSYILLLGSAVQQVSCWSHLHICDGLGFTWSSDWKVDHKMYRSQKCCLSSMSVQDINFHLKVHVISNNNC